MLQVFDHLFHWQTLKFRLREHKENLGGRSHFDLFSDPPVLLNREQGPNWKPFAGNRHDFDLQAGIE